MFTKFSNRFWLIFLWAVLMTVTLATRPLFPIDETRYLAVAWEMWVRGDFLVPYLNGAVYSHKPPLLFWLMQSSWVVFGVNEWSPRLIAPAFALATVFLSGVLAKQLWPGRPGVAASTPFILLGFWFWIVYSTLTMFDMMLAFFVLLGLVGLMQAAAGSHLRYWLMFGVAIGGGILTKGPVVLLHVLPVALLAPWWRKEAGVESNWRHWYWRVLLGVVLGGLLALCWAIPAGIAGGEAYRNAIFMGQTTGRMVNSFAHPLPWWFYLAFLPLLLLPWLIWRPFRSGLKALSFDDGGIRFCIAWFLPVLLAFSLLSGKRLHYLLPIIPALALFIARSVDEVKFIEGQQWHRMITGFTGLIGLAALGLSRFSELTPWPLAISSLSPVWGGLLLSGSLILSFIRADSIKHSALLVCLASVLLLSVLSAGYFSIQHQRYELKAPAEKVAALLSEGKPMVHYRKYHGEYNFYGRLPNGLSVVSDAAAWAELHPDGLIIVAFKRNKPIEEESIVFQHPFKNKTKAVISAKRLLESAELQALLK